MSEMRYLTLVCAVALMGCSGDSPTGPRSLPRMHGARAVGHGPVAALTVAPAAVAIAVGQSATLTATYTDRKGVAFAAASQPITYWGCEPYPACNGTAAISPSSGLTTGGVTARITGRAPGTMTLYATDGLGRHATATVTVTP